MEMPPTAEITIGKDIFQLLMLVCFIIISSYRSYRAAATAACMETNIAQGIQRVRNAQRNIGNRSQNTIWNNGKFNMQTIEKSLLTGTVWCLRFFSMYRGPQPTLATYNNAILLGPINITFLASVYRAFVSGT